MTALWKKSSRHTVPIYIDGIHIKGLYYNNDENGVEFDCEFWDYESIVDGTAIIFVHAYPGNFRVSFIDDRDFTITEVYYNKNDRLALKSEIPEPVDLSGYALKSEIPEPIDLSDYALKSEYDSKITTLEEQIAALIKRIEVLEPPPPPLLPQLPEYYQGYTFRESNAENEYIKIDQRAQLAFDVRFEPFGNDTDGYDSQYIFAFEDDNNVKHYLHLDVNLIENTADYYIDELNGNTVALTKDSSDYCYIPSYLVASFTERKEYQFEKYSKS